ncbi:MAG: 16S rRNA (guanine(966)-N(2))-methyltransferase RsmD [Actinobacteria bacterium]|nr:16S rRNA (guanine(966)-N(2))-methyltransferase RsmD [Actinomycetota bacterium]
MRIVAGTLRGRTFEAPSGDATRPTTDRTREAVFNALASMGVLDDAVVLDLFAGSGAMGLEALSRGARRCTFIERDHRALEVVRGNVSRLGVGDRSVVVAGDVVVNVVAQRGADLVLVDPPYEFTDWDTLLSAISVSLAADAVVVAESGRDLGSPAGWTVVRSKRYGRTWVTFLRADVRTSEPRSTGTVESR